jgi:arsenate reductase (thioredoxin)
MNILFLRTGNSCRSRMAEGWVHSLAGAHPAFRSAGIEAHGKNPRAIAVMREAGVDIGAQESTRLTEEMLTWADLVLTVRGHADEHCPVLPGGTRKLHWPQEDPARAVGSEAEIVRVFRASRDDIKRRVQALLAELH